jgi:hypothetical protein
MKTHTQQQTKLEIETIATEPKLSRRKRSEYKPRKWRGNTLVPVIIALAISALATIAFLNQGANLQEDTKVVAAQNEVIGLLQDYIVAKEMNSNAVPTNNFISGNNATYGAAQAYAGPSGGNSNGLITFHTDTASSCASLALKIPTAGVVGATPTCANNTATNPIRVVLTINVE